MALYGTYITRLVIDTPKKCELHFFPNLEKLTIRDVDSHQLNQINPEILPNLTHLTLLLGSEFLTPSQLVNNVFSNKFPSIEYVNLGRIDAYESHLWTIVPSVHFVSIRSTSVNLMEDILMTCPNLDHLQLHVLKTSETYSTSVYPITYSLRQLTLWSDTLPLSLDDINASLSLLPDLQHLYLQTVYKESLIVLANNLIQRHKYLSRFDCHIREEIVIDDSDSILSSIRQLHPCFTRIKCIEGDYKHQIFATD